MNAPPPIETSEEAILAFVDDAREREPIEPQARAEAVASLADRAARRLLGERERWTAAIARAHGFSAAEAERAVARALEPIRAEDLMEIWRREAAPKFAAGARSPHRAVVIGGGAIPQPTVQAAVAAMMVAERVLYRPSRHDPILAPALGEAMRAENETAFELELLCAKWDRANDSLTRRAVERADALVIFGSEASVAAVSRHLRAGADCFAYGPRISFAAIGGRDIRNARTLAESMKGLADDLFAYDQRGCLSPMALYVVGASEAEGERLVKALAAALEARARRQGYAPSIPPPAAEAIATLRAVYSMDPTRRRRARFAETIPGWTILRDAADAALGPAPGYQTIRVIPLAEWEALLDAVAPMKGRLQAIGMAKGAGERGDLPDSVMDRMRAIGLSGAFRLGAMQAPPLDWIHDGHPFFPLGEVPRARAIEGAAPSPDEQNV
jgi:hypothetical protein